MLEERELYYCESCKNSIPKGKFCPDCGLHNKGEKSTLKTIFTNSLTEVFSVEKGLLYNFKTTFTEPHEIVWSYFNGIRNKYAAPGKFLLYTLFFLGAIYLIDPNFGALEVQYQDESTNSLTGTKIFLIFIIPLLSVSSKIVFWRNKGLAVHILSMIYLFLPRFVIAALLVTVANFSIGPGWSQPLIFLFMIFHTMWTNVRVQKKDPSVSQRIGFTALQFLSMLAIIIILLIILSLIGDNSLIINGVSS